MTFNQPYDHSWRGKAAFAVSKLERARRAVQVCGDACEGGDTTEARRHYRMARDEIASVATEVNSMRSEQLAAVQMERTTVIGSTLAIRGCGAATIALDVMVDAVAGLTVTDDVDDVDVLVGASIDAQQAFGDCTAIVKAAANAHGGRLDGLDRAFNSEGEIALRRRVSDARRRLQSVVSAPSHAKGNVGTTKKGLQHRGHTLVG